MAVNASYSLRAFARDLGISPQQLSSVLNGKRGFSPAMAEKVVLALKLDPKDSILFQSQAISEFSRSKARRVDAEKKMRDLRGVLDTRSLELDVFNVVSNWYHFALLELIKIPTVDSSPAYYSKRLAIPETEISIALGRLQRLKLIKQTSDGGWEVSQATVMSEHSIPNQSVNNYHGQILERAQHALAYHGPDERYGSSSNFAVKTKDLPKAKALIQEFRQRFANEIARANDGEEVFGLSIQFFQLTQTQSQKETKS